MTSHPLKQVRVATTLTQQEFGNLVGCTRVLVRAIENGQRALTRDVAEKVMTATGAYLPSLIEKWPNAVDLEGRPYSAESFANWGVRPGVVSPQEKSRINAWLPRIDLVLDAAATANRLGAALYFLESALDLIVEKFGLAETMRKVLEQRSAVVKSFKVGELRKDPRLAAALGYKDDPRLKDDVEFTATLKRDHNADLAQFPSLKGEILERGAHPMPPAAGIASPKIPTPETFELELPERKLLPGGEPVGVITIPPGDADRLKEVKMRKGPKKAST